MARITGRSLEIVLPSGTEYVTVDNQGNLATGVPAGGSGGGIVVVANMAARDAQSKSVGKQVYTQTNKVTWLCEDGVNWEAQVACQLGSIAERNSISEQIVGQGWLNTDSSPPTHNTWNGSSWA